MQLEIGETDREARKKHRMHSARNPKSNISKTDEGWVLITSASCVEDIWQTTWWKLFLKYTLAQMDIERDDGQEKVIKFKKSSGKTWPSIEQGKFETATGVLEAEHEASQEWLKPGGLKRGTGGVSARTILIYESYSQLRVPHYRWSNMYALCRETRECHTCNHWM